MKIVDKVNEKLAPLFRKSGEHERFYYLFEVIDTFFLTPNERTSRGPHIRDKIDSKRFMMTVVISLIPAIIIGAYNIGFQAYKAIGVDAYYALEFLSEKFDELSEEEKVKTIIHELMHIPKAFGGGFKHHDFVTERNINKCFKEYKKKKEERESGFSGFGV